MLELKAASAGQAEIKLTKFFAHEIFPSTKHRERKRARLALTLAPQSPPRRAQVWA
jgi:hypothetical protein